MSTQINKLNGLDWAADDLEKKFRHSYMYAGIKSTDGDVKKEVVYIRSAAGDGHGHVGVMCDNSKGVSHPLVPYNRFFVEEDRPTPCISSVGEKDAFLFCWNPQRQWRRGWCPDNTFIYMAPSIGASGVWGWDIAKLIYKPMHSHLTEALALFREDRTVKGRALNNRYWLLRKDADSPIQLFRRKCFIGSFLAKKFFISEDAKIFKDELEKELPILREKYSYA